MRTPRLTLPPAINIAQQVARRRWARVTLSVACGRIPGVSGVDTVRGINYQHCHALLVALDVAADPTLAGIRVEGTEDVLDLEVLGPSPSGGSPVVVRGAQMKSRVAPYMWGKGELLKIFRRWADLTASQSAAFDFLTNGELAASGHVVVAALDAARDGDLGLIAGLLGVADTDPMCKIAARVRVVSEPDSVEALLLSAEVEVRARLSIGSRHPTPRRSPSTESTNCSG
jgi:hypothetical protein